MSPEYDADLQNASQMIADLVMEHLATKLAEAPATFDRVVQEVVREVGRRASERVVHHLRGQLVRRALKDGYRHQRSPWIKVGTVFGEIDVRSPYLVKSGKPGRRPLLHALKLRAGGRTVALERAISDFGADVSFERAAEKMVEHYGVVVHRTTVRRLVLKHGHVAEQDKAIDDLYALDEAYEREDAGPPMLVEADGAHIRTGRLTPHPEGGTTTKRGLPRRKRTTEWRETRLAVVRPLGGDSARWTGGIRSLPSLATDIAAEAARIGWSPSTEVTRVTDGGNGLRQALDRVFPVGRHILDFYHLKHHLHETAVAVGARDVEAQVGRWLSTISRGAAHEVLAELRDVQGPAVDRARKFVEYLEKHADCVHYDEYRRLGLPIGSGEVESGHKSTTQARLKLPGCWWLPGNAARVLALRLTRFNGDWGRHWERAAAA